MKLIILFILALTVNGYALTALPRDGEGTKLQSPSWDASLSQAILTTASQNITISGLIWYEFTAVSDCKARLMNTTVKSSWPQFNLYAKTPFRASNWADSRTYKAKFLNLSGCTGDFRAQ